MRIFLYFIVIAVALVTQSGCMNKMAVHNSVSDADMNTTAQALTVHDLPTVVLKDRSTASDAAGVVAKYTAAHHGMFTHKVLAKVPEGLACTAIPEDKTLADVNLFPNEHDALTSKSNFCMPPTDDQVHENDVYKVAFVSDPHNYDTVFDPLNCQLADEGTTAIGLAEGFKEANPLGVLPASILGFATAKWAADEAKKGNYGPAKGFCIVKLLAVAHNIAVLLAL